MSETISRLNAALEDRYAIERELGEGGVATVYLAEIKVTAKLQHPNILPLHDSGAADGFLGYVMPYVEADP